MTIPTLFKEYIWLIETINNAGRISLADISAKWQHRQGYSDIKLSRTTFNRHRDAIQDMFGIVIECDRKDNYRYYIYNKEALKGNSVINWVFSTLSVGNMLNDNIRLQDRILLESIPSGGVYLRRLMKAMRQSCMVTITYQKYSTSAAKTYQAEPYCIKLFKRRWYVLTKVEKSKDNGQKETSMAVFALDRIQDVQLQEKKFILDAAFKAGDYFADSFGVVVDTNTNLERIVLRAYGMERFYLRDLPLHTSQREIGGTEEYADYEIKLRPTSDFKAHLLSRGEWLQVLSPQWLAEDIQNLHRRAAEKFSR